MPRRARQTEYTSRVEPGTASRADRSPARARYAAPWFALALVASLIMGCAGAPPVTLTVFAAASLSDAFNEIGRAFEATRPGVRVTFSFAGSQQLAQQINQGAPADVFASASDAQMDAAVKGGRISPAAPKTFARNRLVVVTANRAGITTLKELSRPGAKLVMADRAVPAGAYSLDFLRRASALPEYGAAFSPTVLANVVSYEQDVRAVLGKVAMGEADAGIVYATDLYGGNGARTGTIAIPDALNTVAAYPICAINDTKQAALAGAFVDFVLGPDGRAVLAKFGFSLEGR